MKRSRPYQFLLTGKDKRRASDQKAASEWNSEVVRFISETQDLLERLEDLADEGGTLVRTAKKLLVPEPRVRRSRSL